MVCPNLICWIALTVPCLHACCHLRDEIHFTDKEEYTTADEERGAFRTLDIGMPNPKRFEPLTSHRGRGRTIEAAAPRYAFVHVALLGERAQNTSLHSENVK